MQINCIKLVAAVNVVGQLERGKTGNKRMTRFNVCVTQARNLKFTINAICWYSIWRNKREKNSLDILTVDVHKRKKHFACDAKKTKKNSKKLFSFQRYPFISLARLLNCLWRSIYILILNCTITIRGPYSTIV